MMFRMVCGLMVGATVLSSSAMAVERGDTCTLQASLPMVVNRPEGRIESSIDSGTEVTVMAVGDEGRTRISTGDATGSVATRDLEAACAGTLQICSLNAAVTMYAKTRSDSQAWRLKPGATISVLRAGKAWAHVRVDDLEGFVKAGELKDGCRNATGSAVATTAEPEVTEEVERGEGPGILFLPFLVEGTAPVGDADEAGNLFYERLGAYRPDAARLPLASASRAAGTWKKHIETSASRARAAGFAYVMVGKVGMETVDGKAGLVLSMVVVDAKASRSIKGVRVRPTKRVDDVWPEQILSTLLPLVAGAPGGRNPVAPRVAAEPTATPSSPPTPTFAETTMAAPWFANPWGYVAAGSAVVAGVGAGVMGSMALDGNSAANATSGLDATRGTLRSEALQWGMGSDALTGVAVVAGVTAVVVFATRAGMGDPY